MRGQRPKIKGLRPEETPAEKIDGLIQELVACGGAGDPELLRAFAQSIIRIIDTEVR
jgi:hypothetical protein